MLYQYNRTPYISIPQTNSSSFSQSRSNSTSYKTNSFQYQSSDKNKSIQNIVNPNNQNTNKSNIQSNSDSKTNSKFKTQLSYLDSKKKNQPYFSPNKIQNLSINSSDLKHNLDNLRTVSINSTLQPKKNLALPVAKTLDKDDLPGEKKIKKIQLFKKKIKETDFSNIILNTDKIQDNKKLNTQKNSEQEHSLKSRNLSEEKMNQGKQISVSNFGQSEFSDLLRLQNNNKLKEQIKSLSLQLCKLEQFYKNQIQRIKKQNESIRKQNLGLREQNRGMLMERRQQKEIFIRQKMRLEQQLSKVNNMRLKYEAQNERLLNRIRDLEQKLRKEQEQSKKLNRYNFELSLDKNNLKKSIGQYEMKVNELQRKIKEQSFEQLYKSKKLQVSDLQNRLKNRNEQIQLNKNRHNQILKETQHKFQQQRLYYQHKIIQLNRQNQKLKLLTNKRINQTHKFNQVLKQQITQTQKLKLNIKLMQQQTYKLFQQLQSQKLLNSNQQECLKIQKIKYQTQINNVHNRYQIAVQNMQHQKQTYVNILKVFQQKIHYLIQQNTQKDQFMQNYLKGFVQNSQIKTQIQQFFSSYASKIPKQNLAQLIYNQIQQSLYYQLGTIK